MDCLALLILLGQGGETVPPQHPVRPQFYVAPAYGPMLAEIKSTVRVMSRGGSQLQTVFMPVPSSYSGQTTIDFDVQVQPSNALIGWKVKERPDGLNRIAEVEVAPGDGEVSVTALSRVLVPGFEVLRNQKKDFYLWQGPTVSVQSDSPKILEQANELAKGLSDRSKLVERIVKWSATVHKDEVRDLKNDDAMTTLQYGGDALGRSNLCAALLRALKIPARIVGYFPNWAARMEAQSWGVQYQSDEGVWATIDPFVGIQFPVRNSAVIMSISSRIDESHGVPNPSALLPKAPSYSTTELSGELQWAESNRSIRHTEIRPIRVFPRASGARLMFAGYRRSLRVFALTKKGIPDWHSEAEMQRVMRKGPINLALFLDGQPTFPDR